MKTLEILPDNIPGWHISLVNERLEDYQKDPSKALDFDAVMIDIEKEL